MNRENPTVSVIMPVYNAKEYVADAVKSVLNQTFKDFELILVDDGATDGSSQICDKYAETDDRITVIHKENGGICSARNAGMECAKGKYLAFCDHDDIYLENYLETAVKAADDSNSKLVKFTYKSEVWSGGQKTKEFIRKLPNKSLDVFQLVNCYDLFNYTLRALWNGIYLRDIIIENNIKFNENVKFGMEDYLFNLKVLEHIDEVKLISDTLFIHYSRFNQSTSEKYAPQRYADIIDSSQTEKLFLQKYKTNNDEIWIRHQCQYLILYMRTLTNPDNPMSKKEKIAELKKLNTSGKLALLCKRSMCFKALPKFPKEAVISILYNYKAYSILLWAYEKHRKRSN